MLYCVMHFHVWLIVENYSHIECMMSSQFPLPDPKSASKSYTPAYFEMSSSFPVVFLLQYCIFLNKCLHLAFRLSQFKSIVIPGIECFLKFHLQSQNLSLHFKPIVLVAFYLLFSPHLYLLELNLIHLYSVLYLFLLLFGQSLQNEHFFTLQVEQSALVVLAHSVESVLELFEFLLYFFFLVGKCIYFILIFLHQSVNVTKELSSLLPSQTLHLFAFALGLESFVDFSQLLDFPLQG